MAIRRYDSTQKYGDSELALSPLARLLIWAYQNPEKALEVGAKLAVVGGLIWFLGTLFEK